MSPQTVLASVLWPAVVSMSVLLLGLGLRRWPHSGRAAGAAAIGAAFITGEIVTRGIPHAFPADATRWLPHLALGLGAVGVLRALAGGALWMLAVSGLALGAAVALLLGPGLQWREGWFNAIVTLVVAAIAVAAAYRAGRRAVLATPAWMSPLLLALLCVGGMVALAQSYTVSIGRVLLGLAGGLGPVALMTAWWARVGTAAGALPLATTLLALTLLVVQHYSALPLGSALLLLAGALVPALLSAPGLRPLRLWWRLAIGAAAIAGLSAAAIWLTPGGFDFDPY